MLLAYNPSTRETRCVADGLRFANGAAVSAAGDFVAVAETNLLRVTRVWVAGPKARFVGGGGGRGWGAAVNVWRWRRQTCCA